MMRKNDPPTDSWIQSQQALPPEETEAMKARLAGFAAVMLEMGILEAPQQAATGEVVPS